MYFYIYYKIGSSFWLWCMVHLLYLMVITYPLDDVTVIQKMSWEMNHETQWKKKRLMLNNVEKYSHIILLWCDVVIYIGPVLYSKNIIQKTLLSFIFHFHSKPNILWNACFTKKQQPTRKTHKKEAQKYNNFLIKQTTANNKKKYKFKYSKINNNKKKEFVTILSDKHFWLPKNVSLNFYFSLHL